MKTTKQHAALSRTAIALAVLSVFNAAHAEDEVAQLIKPESSISVGLASASGDSKSRAIFGQYNGMRNADVYGLLDFDYVSRDDASGTWTRAKGSNLGLSSRELGFSREKQGAWKYSIDYSELDRNYLRTINTGMSGAGTTTPGVTYLAVPGTGNDVNLHTKRSATGLGFEKWISPSLQFEANFKSEEKSGARIWGRGYACEALICAGGGVTAAVLLMPEPIDSVTKQIDAKLNFHTDKLLLTGGYYGSFYNNAHGSLTPGVENRFNRADATGVTGAPAVAGGTSLADVMRTPMALPPDNQAHQLYVNGNYTFTPKARANFKLSYARATQNDSFAGAGLFDGPAGVDSLDARVDNTLAQVGFSANPIDKLSVIADARYDHKADKTPRELYNAWRAYTWFNSGTESTRISSKLEASYRLPANLRATLGLDHNSIKREVPETLSEENVGGLVALRGKNTENGWRAELRSSMSETINGGISYTNSRRSGSDWTSLSLLDPSNVATLGANAAAQAANRALINLYCGGLACYGQQIPGTSIIGLTAGAAFPMFMTDSKREKVKLSADWNPTDRLSLQFIAEDSKETNLATSNPVAGGKGWRGTDSRLYSVDAALALTEAWKLTAYASRGDQTQRINHSSGYMADINDKNDGASLGFVGLLASGLFEVGGNVTYLRDVNKYGLAATSTTSGTLPGPLTSVAPSAVNVAQAAIGLPDLAFRQVNLRVYGKYAIDKKSAVRVDLIHQRAKLNEWQWENNGVPFAYADNTTVSMLQSQNVTVVGVSYVHKF
ncbi:MAG: MtrB/PioB family decaheme-associated outer membrane protein [Burkholderiaceae bacterium]|nr:MtrB/PioB family decaheme-associated outer membrane protein [Burkholderiaceae bacterium]